MSSAPLAAIIADRKVKLHQSILAALLTCCAPLALAQNASPRYDLKIEAQPLGAALKALAAQTGLQVLLFSEDAGRTLSPQIHGKFTNEEALAKILGDSGLTYEKIDDHTVAIRRKAAPAAATAELRSMSYEPGESAPAAHSDGQSQSGAGAADPGKSATPVLDVVIVTASLRREPAREVPMQVNSISADALERVGAKNLGEYLSTQPGVDVSSSGSAKTSVSIRGVTTGTGAATVGVYLDNIATGSSNAFISGATLPLNMGLLDLDHIEVVRGPQGTLYGAGAVGGVIKYLTNQPNTEVFSGKVNVEGSVIEHGGVGYTASGVLNLPISPGLAAVRVAAMRDHAGGYYDSIGPVSGTNIDRGNIDGARISALITPLPELAIRLSATLQNLRANALNIEDVNPNTLQPLYGDLTRKAYIQEPQRYRFALYGLDVEYDFGWARFNAITSSQIVRQNMTQDATSSLEPLLPYFGAVAASANVMIRQDRISQEFRLTSRSDDHLEWLMGLYATHERGDGYGDLTAIQPTTTLELQGTPQLSTYDEFAAYGDVTWKVTTDLAFTGGVRVAYDHQDYTSIVKSVLFGPQTNGGPSSETTATWLGTTTYKLNSTSNVYLRAASGYRPGGPNGMLPVPPIPFAKPSFRPDDLWSYEAGYKADLLDHKLALEAAIYDIEWHDIQQPVSSGYFSYYVNAGDARIRGAELTANWMPTTDWRVNASASFIDGKLLNAPAELQIPPDSRLPGSARVSANLGLTRLFRVASYPATVGADARYIGERTGTYALAGSALPAVNLPGYTAVDLRGGITFGDFDLRAYVRNVTDKRGAYGAVVPTATSLGLLVIQPRTFGVGLTYSFQ